MSTPVELRIAELFIGSKGETVTTNGVGSCVVVVIYDKVAHMGAIAHVILPHARPDDPKPVLGPDTSGRLFVKYADQAIDVLVHELERRGGVRAHMVGKLVGGAHMFALLEGDQHGIGWQNVAAARERLGMFGVPVETEVVGGTTGRNVRFDCSTGIVEIVTKV